MDLQQKEHCIPCIPSQHKRGAVLIVDLSVEDSWQFRTGKQVGGSCAAQDQGVPFILLYQYVISLP